MEISRKLYQRTISNYIYRNPNSAERGIPVYLKEYLLNYAGTELRIIRRNSPGKKHKISAPQLLTERAE